jgi:hypothetical protein
VDRRGKKGFEFMIRLLGTGEKSSHDEMKLVSKWLID